MRVNPLRDVLLLLSLVTVACHESPTSPGEPLTIRSLYSGSDVYLIAGRTETITSQQRLQEVWSEIHPGDLGIHAAPVPVVDFSRESMLFAARGQQNDGCHQIKIAQATLNGSLVMADVEAIDMTGCICPQLVTYPLELVAVATPHATAVYRQRTVTQRCQ